jgi:hypothetical protein
VLLVLRSVAKLTQDSLATMMLASRVLSLTDRDAAKVLRYVKAMNSSCPAG